MEGSLGNLFVALDINAIWQVVLLGFIGGVLSGFIGSGGAFFMSPGMMNLGIPGVVAIGSNITHKFGKAMMGAKKHGELGHVDKKLGLFLILTACAGIRIAVWINCMLFQGENAQAKTDLYISVVFVGILTLVGISILRDAWKSSNNERNGGSPSRKIVDFFARLKLYPMIYFPVADVRVSLWILLVIGLATGYLAGTIGVGGFIGVPAMIYILGVPTQVAAGTELYLAMFMGAFGALNYAYAGFVDIRLVMLLYLGSLVGLYIGAYGTKVVKEVLIRMVTAVIILICVVSRAVAVPIYLRQLGFQGFKDIDARYDSYFNHASKILLLVAGITGTIIILYSVLKAYRRRNRVQKTLRTETR